MLPTFEEVDVLNVRGARGLLEFFAARLFERPFYSSLPRGESFEYLSGIGGLAIN